MHDKSQASPVSSPNSPQRTLSQKRRQTHQIPKRTHSKLDPKHFRNIYEENYSIQELFECFNEETLNKLILRLIRYTDEYYSRINSRKGETIIKSPQMRQRVTGAKKLSNEELHSDSDETSTKRASSDTNNYPNSVDHHSDSDFDDNHQATPPTAGEPSAFEHIKKQSFCDKITFLNRHIWKHGCELFVSHIILSQTMLTPIFSHLKTFALTSHYFDVITDFQDQVLHRSQIRDIITDSKSILTFLRYLSLDLLNQICEKMGFREESNEKDTIVESLQEEILLLGLRLVLNLLSAETLRSDVYPELVDIPDRQVQPSARYLSKKEIVANVLGLCFPFYILEYKKRIEVAKQNRPALNASISKEDIVIHYTSHELSEFCREIKLKNTGTKREKALRIKEYFGEQNEDELEKSPAKESALRRTPIRLRKRKRQSTSTVEENTDTPTPASASGKTTRRKRRRISLAPK